MEYPYFAPMSEIKKFLKKSIKSIRESRGDYYFKYGFSGKEAWSLFQQEAIGVYGLQASDTHKYPDWIEDLIIFGSLQDDQGDGFLRYIAATLILSGRRTEIPKSIALCYYVDAIDRGPRAVRILALRNLVIRLILGKDIPRNPRAALMILDDFPDYRCEHEDRYTAIESLLNRYNGPIGLEEIGDVISGIGPIISIHDRMVYFDDIDFSKQMLEQLACLVILSRGENWGNTQALSWLLARQAAKECGHDASLIDKNTLDFGPFYNSIDVSGRPIIGEYASFVADPHAKTINTIHDGISIIKGVSLSHNGEIKIHSERGSGLDALIFPEDLAVIILLVFGSDEVIWPAVSVACETIDNSCLLNLRRNYFEPHWVGSTMFGRTMYFADVMAGELVWSIKEFNISKDILPQSLHKWKNIINEIELEAGDDPIGFRAVINFNVDSVDIVERLELSKKSYFIKDLKFKISTGFTNEHKLPNGKAHWYFRDENYLHNKIGRIVTKHLEDIFLLIPAFERMRQLSALLYLLVEGRKGGFRPNPKTLDELRDWQSKHYLPLPYPWARHFPLDWSQGIGC